MRDHKPKKGKPAVTPQAEIRRLKKRLRWLEYANAELLKAVDAHIKKELLSPEARAETEAWAESEVAPLLKNPKALEAALKGPTLLDVIKGVQGGSHKKRATR